MVKWASVSNPRGVYTSPIYSISNVLDKYVATIKANLQNVHSQKVEYYFRVSYDAISWTDWKKFYTTSFDLLDEYRLNGLYFQYKIAMVAENDTKKPYMKSFSMEFEPFSYIDNLGDLPIKPKIWIRKKNGDGNIAIINHSTGQRVELTNLKNNEEIYIDGENEEIVSSLQETLQIYRYDNHNDEYLELVRGDNFITSEGDFELDIRYKFKLLQE